MIEQVPLFSLALAGFGVEIYLDRPDRAVCFTFSALFWQRSLVVDLHN